ncbi:WD-40 repeat-containing protein MSI4-like [Humulus lupulus]|uniref:WD-40 repeat-containing protein MSI4-like n=1 Tax=Humulus lupulus TaxID=3486 RepID=UPI002B412164|nr:WD-40 repeat-containing protein MSI4-like [Humulus lupulus]
MVVGKDKFVVLWSIQDHISTAATRSGGSIIKNTKPGEGSEKAVDGLIVAPRGIYYGHEDTVEGVTFCPSSSQEFCSVGDESCLILWDARTGSSPAVKVEKAHDVDLYCVDWSPHDDNIILTVSDNNSLRMFDRPNLTSSGVGAPIHKFEGHKAIVLCVQWSRDRSYGFGSSA